MENSYDLRKIDYYKDMGIAFVFSCANTEQAKGFDTDPKYNLIKITNLQSAEKLLHYEQFNDYAASPIKLANQWFYVEQHMYVD